MVNFKNRWARCMPRDIKRALETLEEVATSLTEDENITVATAAQCQIEALTLLSEAYNFMSSALDQKAESHD